MAKPTAASSSVLPGALPGGDLEDAVLQHLWSVGPATARDTFDAVGAPRGLVYTTVARVLDRLVDKGLVSCSRAGRLNRYQATTARDQVVRSLITARIGGWFAGDPQPAVAALLGAVQDIDAALLEELERQLELRRTQTEGEDGADGT